MPVKINYPITVAWILHPHIGGWIGGYFTRKQIEAWYQPLKKPRWTPPNWVFAPVWTGLYCTMGYSSYLVWKEGGGFQGAAMPLTIYTTNLALNWAWTPVFLGIRNMKLALYEITALWGSTVAMGIAFYNVNPTAGYLVIPYFLWNSFATVLTYFIYRDNKPAVKANEDEKKE